MLDQRWRDLLSLRAFAGKGRARATVGIHVSGDRIAAVRVRAGSPLPVLEDLRQFPIEPGKEANAPRMLTQGDLLSGARVVLILPAGKYETVTIATPPQLPEDELHDALRWQLRGAIAYPPEEAALSFLHLPPASNATNSAGAPAPVLVVAAQRREVARAVRPFLAAGIEVEVVDIPEMAQHNLVVANDDLSACQGFLSFDGLSALLTVQLGDELCFSRRMPLPGTGGLGEDEPEHVADRIAINVQRSLEVVARQTSLPEVTKLLLGPHLHASLIARAIREQAEVETELFSPATVVALAKDGPASAAIVQDRMSSELILALGAALRDDARRGPVAGASGALPGWLQALRKAA